MDIDYWSRVGENYDSEIFSVYANDKNKIIPDKINPLLNRRHTAADFGCGVGSFLPLLSGGFKQVHAIDFSASCLKQASETYGALANVTFEQADLARGKLSFSKVHFAMCCNVIISPSISIRSKILKNIHRHLYRNGHLILIVPSLESAMFSGFRLIDWNLKAGHSPAGAVRCGFEVDRVPMSKFYQGVVDIENVGTKHFLREELQVLLADMRFDVQDICKIEYDWRSEFADPPSWMQSPYPWDWLVIAQKR